MQDHVIVKAKPKWSDKDPRQQEMTDLLVDFIACSLQPLSRVDDPHFRILLNKAEPAFTIPSRKHLSSKLLASKKKELHTSITNLFSQLPNQSLAAGVDIWSSSDMRSFVGVTGHIIVNFKLESVMLACKRFKGPHTGERIQAAFQEVINSFNLENKVLTTITDSASNMLKAFVTLPGYQENTQDNVDSEDEDNEVNTLEEDDNLMDYLPEHIRCFLHNVNNTVKDGLEKTGQITTVIAKASKLVSHVRHSVLASEILENQPKLQAKNVTRWNSSNKMLQSILKVDPSKFDELDFPGTLTKYELKCIKEVTDILTPFQVITSQCEGHLTVTSSLVIPLIRVLKVELEELTSTYKSKMLDTLISSVDKRLSLYEKKELFQVAAMLDPRFKTAWCTEDEVEPMKALLHAKVNQLTPPTTSTQPDTSSPPKKKSKLFKFLTSRSVTTVSTSTPSEVDTYLSQPLIDEESDPLIYWQQQQATFPQLTSLALRYLAVPASSAPVERLFSVAGKVFRPDRNRLSDERFEELMFIKCNKHLQL